MRSNWLYLQTRSCGKGTGFDLARIGCYGDVGNRGVLRLARADG